VADTIELTKQCEWEDGNVMLQSVGSFWNSIFSDRDRMETEYDALGELYVQAQQNFLEAVACLSRIDIPVFHRERWHFIVLKQSELVADETLLAYGDDAVYGPQPSTGSTFTYGVQSKNAYAYNLPDTTLADVTGYISNRMLDPSVIFTKGADFVIDRDKQLIKFALDPFENTLFSQRPVYKDNVVVDTELAMWVFNGDFDRAYLYNHFGYTIGVQARSTQAYKDFINAYFNMMARTPTLADVRLMLTALTGVPTVIETQEEVKFIELTDGALEIITDFHVYRFQAAATAIVTVGDIVEQGDELINGVKLIELSGSSRDLTSIRAFALDENFLDDILFANIAFPNVASDLVYLGPDADGKVEVRFDVAGFDEDVAHFWQVVHTNGKLAGQTLAEALDTRLTPAPEIQPQPQNLPKQINPLKLLVDNLLKYNLYLIYVQTDSIDPNAMGFGYMREFRRVLCPNTTFMVLVETPSQLDTIDLTEAVDTVAEFEGPEALLEEVATTPTTDCWVEETLIRPHYVEE